MCWLGWRLLVPSLPLKRKALLSDEAWRAVSSPCLRTALLLAGPHMFCICKPLCQPILQVAMRGLATLPVTIATDCERCEIIYIVCLCMLLNYVNLSVVVPQAFFGTTRQDIATFCYCIFRG